MLSNVTAIGYTGLVCLRLSSKQANTGNILISVLKIHESYSTWATSSQERVPRRSQSSGNLLPLPESSALPSSSWDWDVSVPCGRLSKHCI